MQTQVCVCAHTRMYACMHNTHTHTQHTRILLYCFPLTRGAGHPRAVHAREDLVQLNYRDYSIMTSQSAGLKKILKPRSLCTARNRSHATPLPSRGLTPVSLYSQKPESCYTTSLKGLTPVSLYSQKPESCYITSLKGNPSLSVQPETGVMLHHFPLLSLC